MRAAVVTAFPSYTAALEGVCTWPYLDVKCLVTTGEGDLIDPIGDALGLPWCIDGNPALPASQGEVESAWYVVKNATHLSQAGGGAFASLTRVRLTPDGVAQLVARKLAEMETIIRERFANWDELPADAQLGVMSIAWACGPGFRFPRFEAALGIEDFARYDASGALIPGCCAAECGMSTTGNPGVRPRNADDVRLFEAAQRVVDGGLDPDVLTGWP